MKKPINTSYTHKEHKHRFAAWCSSTAARASRNCRFKVSQGVQILTLIDIASAVESKSNWGSEKMFDIWHENSCDALVLHAENLEINGFTFGVAAKMVNCYVKAFTISDTHQCRFAHPPIDRLLLLALEENNFGERRDTWRFFKNIGWSNFTKAQYSEVIRNIKESLHCSQELWEVESYWDGFQH